MELVRDTPFEHGVVYWSIDPPHTSMVVAVKATYVIGEDGLTLAEPQPPTTGELYWDDDPERSVRVPSDFALAKPRGECFVFGHCRPLTGQPETQTLAGFKIGSIKKSFIVYGDREWEGGRPGRARPFTEMPLCWERAFGGAKVAANPIGAGLPNIEREGQTVTSKDSRPAPIGAFPISSTWSARTQFVGTYDARWRARRFPWLPEDFRVAFFNEAPLDQQIDGYWRGDEKIELRQLHPTLPRVRATLPKIIPRVFVEHDERSATPERFDEIALVLDTIHVDADAGTVSCVWRGQKTLATQNLAPDGLGRIFTMHEDLSEENVRRASVDQCHVRMQQKLAEQQAERDALAGAAPESEAPPAVDAADAAASAPRAVEDQAAADEMPTVADQIQEQIDELKEKLGASGVDVEKINAENLAAMPEGEPPTRDALEKFFESNDFQVPEEDLDGLFKVIEDQHAPDEPPPEPPPKPDLREIVIDCHRRRVPIEGDFTGVNLAALDLRGLDARDAILMDANFRGTSLMNAKLDGAVLIRADFLSANLSSASLRKADLEGAVLEDALLTGARLDGANLSRVEMQGATLHDARLSGADLTGAILDGASLAGAVCDATVFNQASLKECSLAGASLVEARLYGTTAPGLNLDRSNMSKARVGRGADLSGASIRGVEGKYSNWRNAKLTAVRFNGTVLTGADFTDADLENAQLGGVSMRRAVFQGSKLVGASLAGADVYEGSFVQSDLSRTDLRGANLYSANFYGAHGEGASLAGANLDGTYWEKS